MGKAISPRLKGFAGAHQWQESFGQSNFQAIQHLNGTLGSRFVERGWGFVSGQGFLCRVGRAVADLCWMFPLSLER